LLRRMISSYKSSWRKLTAAKLLASTSRMMIC